MNKFKFEKAVLMIGLGICLAMFIGAIVLSVKFDNIRYILDGVPFFCYSMFILTLMNKNKELKKYVLGWSTLVMIMSKMAHDLSRYEKMYGKLPEEETKEEGTNEEKKEE
jgi:hypothetical protein